LGGEDSSYQHREKGVGSTRDRDRYFGCGVRCRSAPRFARTVHKLAVPIVLLWIGFVVVLTMFVPDLEEVGKEHTVSMSPNSAASMQATKRVG
jgi:hypothetical protein